MKILIILCKIFIILFIVSSWMSLFKTGEIYDISNFRIILLVVCSVVTIVLALLFPTIKKD